MAVTNEALFPRLNLVNDAVTGRQFVQILRWDGGGVNDILQINDSNGRIVWGPVTASANNFIDFLPVYRVLDGLTATTLDGGFVTIYIR